jgi:hypothetical protein
MKVEMVILRLPLAGQVVRKIVKKNVCPGYPKLLSGVECEQLYHEFRVSDDRYKRGVPVVVGQPWARWSKAKGDKFLHGFVIFTTILTQRNTFDLSAAPGPHVSGKPSTLL